MTENTIKNIIMVVAIILCLALAGGWIAQTVVNSKKEKENTTFTAFEETDGMRVGLPNESNGISLLSARIASETYAENGISAQTESAYTLTATLEPENAEGSVDWNVAWVNSASEWANGKTVTDYITVTPVSDGALIANAECKQAFGEQINITVSLRGDYDCSANCTCDYTKKLIGFENFEVSALGSNKFFLNSNMTSYTFDISDSFICSLKSTGYVFSDYTIDDLKGTGISVDFSAEFKQLCSENGYGNIRYGNFLTGTSLFYGNNSYFNQHSNTAAQANILIEFMRQHLDVPVYSVGVYSLRTGEKKKLITIPIYFSETSLPLVVESVSLNDSNLIM